MAVCCFPNFVQHWNDCIDDLRQLGDRVYRTVEQEAHSIGPKIHHVGLSVSKEMSRLAGPESGLSDLFRVTIMFHAVMAEVASQGEIDDNRMLQAISSYRQIIDATRFLTSPIYFFGKELQEDIQKSRWLAISGNVVSIFTNCMTASILLYDNFVIAVPSWKTFTNNDFVLHTRAFFGYNVGSLALFYSFCMFGESARDIYYKKAHPIFAVLNCFSKSLDIVETVFEIFPIPSSPLFKASFGLAAASMGLVTFFVEPYFQAEA